MLSHPVHDRGDEARTSRICTAYRRLSCATPSGLSDQPRPKKSVGQVSHRNAAGDRLRRKARRHHRTEHHNTISPFGKFLSHVAKSKAGSSDSGKEQDLLSRLRAPFVDVVRSVRRVYLSCSW